MVFQDFAEKSPTFCLICRSKKKRFYISLSICSRYRYLDKVIEALWATFWRREQPSSDLWKKYARVRLLNFQKNIGFVCVRPNLPSQIGGSNDYRLCNSWWVFFLTSLVLGVTRSEFFRICNFLGLIF